MKKFLSLFLVLIFVFSASEGKNYTVKKGDTLWDIAGFYLNNPFLWPDIYELNKDKIENPHWIYPGQVFELPIPGSDKTSVPNTISNVTNSGAVESNQSNGETVKFTDLSKRYEGKKLSMAWLKAQRMIQKSDYIELFHIPNNVSYDGIYYGGFVSPVYIEKGRIIATLGDNSLESGAVRFDRVKIDLGKDKVKKGDKFTIFSYGKTLKSGNEIGKIVKIFGSLKVTETFDNYSICTITSNRDIIRKGLLITNLWTPPFIPDFDLVKAKNNVYAKILGYRDNQSIVKDYNIAYVNEGKKEGFTQGDKFNIIDDKGNIHGELQLLWVGDYFSTGYVTRTADINLKKYDKIELSMKSLPKNNVKIIKSIPVEKVSKSSLTKENQQSSPAVINEKPEKATPKDTTIVEQTKIVRDTIKTDSNATIIEQKPETTETMETVPVIEEQAPADSDTTSTVIEEQSTQDTTSVIVPADSDTTTTVIEEGN